MSWVRVDDKAWSHPKISNLSANGVRLWIFSLCWCNEHETDGVIPSTTLRLLKGTKRSAEELVSAGLWEATEKGWEIHDFLQFQPSRAQKNEQRAKTADRVKRFRNAVTPPNKSARVTPEKRSSNDAPVPGPTRPVPIEMNRSGGEGRPRNLEEALMVPIAERAQLLIDTPQIGTWLQPHRWPEVTDLAQSFSAGLKWHAPRFTKPSKAVERMVELLATYSRQELAQAVAAAPRDDWLTEGTKGLTALTVDVVGQLLNGKRPKRAEGKRQPDYEGEKTFSAEALFAEDERKAGI